MVVVMVLSNIHTSLSYIPTIMMDFKLSVLITLALFALTVLSQQDSKAAQVGTTTNTASPAVDAPAASSANAKSIVQECMKRCRGVVFLNPYSCMAKCASGK